MCVNVCVCIFVSMYLCIYVSMCAHVNIYIYMCTYGLPVCQKVCTDLEAAIYFDIGLEFTVCVFTYTNININIHT